MKLTAGALGAGVIGLTACGTAPVIVMQSPTAAGHSVAAAASSAAKSAATPATTKTVVRYRTVAPSATPSAATAAPSAAPTPAPPQQPDQNVTDAWAVVSAYYGDIESGNYQQAYALIGNGATTGQSYQQFVAGFACTGAQVVTENSDSGDQVNFDLAATNSCTGATQSYTGTDTVQNGIIVGANVVQTG